MEVFQSTVSNQNGQKQIRARRREPGANKIIFSRPSSSRQLGICSAMLLIWLFGSSYQLAGLIRGRIGVWRCRVHHAGHGDHGDCPLAAASGWSRADYLKFRFWSLPITPNARLANVQGYLHIRINNERLTLAMIQNGPRMCKLSEGENSLRNHPLVW